MAAFGFLFHGTISHFFYGKVPYILYYTILLLYLSNGIEHFYISAADAHVLLFCTLLFSVHTKLFCPYGTITAGAAHP
jgi:hypothetical protein